MIKFDKASGKDKTVVKTVVRHEHKKLHRYQDQYFCHHCQKQWDVKDKEWPRCKTGHDIFLDLLDKLKFKNKADKK